MTIPFLQLNTITIKDSALADKISLAADCGYDALEVWAHEVTPHLLTEADWEIAQGRYLVPRPADSNSRSAMESAARLTAEHGMPIAGLIPGPDSLVRWHDSLDQDMLASMTNMVDACVALGGRYVILPVLGDGGSLQGTADNLKRIAEHAAPKGIRLGIEPMGHVRKCSRVPEALEVLELAGLGRHAGLVVDCFHFFRAGQDVSAIAAIRSDQIVMVHVNDALDLPLEQLVGNKHRAYSGHGIFDVVEFCTAILDTGYDGPFSTEIMNEAYWNDDPAAVCDMAYSTTRAAVEQAFSDYRDSEAQRDQVN